ncbi:MAG: glutamate-5-semialdehyde dehydrogenase [Patescibacteria group bacterium]
MNVKTLALTAQEASRKMALLSTAAKNGFLIKIARNLASHKKEILTANKEDLEAGKKNNLAQNMLDRLMLNEDRLDDIIRAVENVATLKDYVGEVLDEHERRDGLQIKRMRVPLGVIAMIYEARPNVTVDSACLAIKSGNAVILKGGSDALHSNRALVKYIQEALEPFNSAAVQLIDSTDREDTQELLQQKGIIDVIIPRGGQGLIDFVTQNATVPVIETGASVVHIYVDEFADMNKAVPIVINAKLRRTSICNALDVLLLHESVAEKFLKKFCNELTHSGKQLEIRADEKSFAILQKISAKTCELKPASHSDYDTEFLDSILAIKTVNHLDEAIEHIFRHSQKHSEAIVTEDAKNAARFLSEVDAACVYHNASTQFSDGGEFGLGAEIGISTQKLHARGPFALEGLTTYKWVIEGSGQTRN